MDFSNVDMGELGRQLLLKILKATSSEGSFEDKIEECKANCESFEDESFPATQASLISNWKDEQVQDKVATWRNFEWKRPHQIPSIGKNPQVFYQNIDPSDIGQGLLGDCYFLSSLSVLAEHPDRIKKLFVSSLSNEWGVYAVQICKNGIWKEVVIDDLFPCYNGEPAFSRAHGSELWVLILEKAWAKVHGSYERIEAGFAENVLRDLTGAPSEVVHHDEEDFWDKLVEAEANGYLMAASAGATQASKELLESLGLIGNHSYGLLDARNVQTPNGPIKLLKLRNPWGDFEWKGDWGDDSELWTPELERQLNQKDGNDGTFWMCLDDFVHYFSKVQICRF